MKKWIPKNTVYCYEHLKPKNDGSGAVSYVGHCKWRKRRKHSDPEYGTEYEIYCEYLGKFDSELSCGLLWDACKECGEHYDNEQYENKCAKWRYRNRKKIEKLGW
jgi:hypothetical protein